MPETLSICIPTFNRVKCLRNCLESIYQSKKKSELNFDVCISDNNSTEDVDSVINEYRDKLKIKFNKNLTNLGLGINILKSVELSNAEFAWIIGNDDMLLDKTLKCLEDLFKKNLDIDYYFINSFHLSSEHVFKFNQPFNHMNLPEYMSPFSKKKQNKRCKYFDLIRPDYAFDFLLGMFLNIFRRKKWVENIDQIDRSLVSDTRVMSNIYNTFPHNIIFAKAFKNSNAFFHSDPLSIALYGERDWWKDLYPFVEAIRIPELVDVYRKNGLNYFKYLICKNFALRKLFSNLIKVYILPEYNGFQYLNFRQHILKNLHYPSIYIMPFYYLIRKIFKLVLEMINKIISKK